jgi:hypothetical protein
VAVVPAGHAPIPGDPALGAVFESLWLLLSQGGGRK